MELTHLTAVASDEKMGFTAGMKYPIVYQPIENGASVLEDVYFIWVINDRMDSVNARAARFEEEPIIKSVVDRARNNK